MAPKKGVKKKSTKNMMPLQRIQTAEGWRRQIYQDSGKRVKILPANTSQE